MTMESRIYAGNSGPGSRGKRGAADPFSLYNDSEEDLAKLMPNTKRQFKAQLQAGDENRQLLNHSQDDGKENMISRREQTRRRVGSGRVTNITALTFDDVDKMVDTPSPRYGSFYQNVSNVLKDNKKVGNATPQILNDFWNEEEQKRISAVARRKLERGGRKKVVEDRFTRHLRSRRTTSNRRISSACLDFNFDATRIAEWDQEELVVETARERPFSDIGTSGSTGVRCSDNEITPAVNISDVPSAAHVDEDSAMGSLPDMDVSGDGSAEACERARRQTFTSAPMQDSGCGRTESDGKVFNGDPGRDDIRGRASLGDIAADSSQAAFGYGKSSGMYEKGQHPVKNPFERRNTTSRFSHVSPFIKQSAFTESLSPTPPSNPIANFKPQKCLDAKVGQRKLAFYTMSPSSESSANEKTQTLDFDVESIRAKRSSDHVQQHDINVSNSASGKQIDFGRATHSAQDQETPQASFSPDVEAKDDNVNVEVIASPKGLSKEQETPPVYEDKIEYAGEGMLKGEELATSSNAGTKCEEPSDRDDQGTDVELLRPGGLEADADFMPSEAHKTDVDLMPSPNLGTEAELLAKSDQAADVEAVAFGNLDADAQLQASGARAVHAEVHASGNDAEVIAGRKATVAKANAPEGHVTRTLETEDEELSTRGSLDLPSNPQRESNDGDTESAESSHLRTKSYEDAAALDASQEDVGMDQNSEGHDDAAQRKTTSKRVDKKTKKEAAALDACQEGVGIDQNSECHDDSAQRGNASKIINKKTKKQKRNQEKKRFSLADQGTLWQDGLRRSQRIRVKPLEWWRGERLLYGRIHESCESLVGIKHSSPTKYAQGIRVPFTVDSFVSPSHDNFVKFLGS